MENLTHSLVGAVIADAALGAGATRPERRRFIIAGVIAANAPDLDLLYTSITPMPIGYLLHHRGHTHTLVGLVVLFAIFAGIARLIRSRLAREPSAFRRLSVVLAAGLVSHLALDAANSYGVHPFFPVDNRWYYGDAFFIFEPWLWAVLAAAAAMNATTIAGRVLLGTVAVAAPVSTVLIDLVPWPSIALLGAVTGALAWFFRHRPRATKAAMALGFCVMFAIAMVLLSRQARATALNGIAMPPSAHVLDIVLTPSPALPLCWAVIVVERDDQAGMLVLRRGSLSLLPGLRPAAACPLNRLVSSRPLDRSGNARFVLVDESRVPLDLLRTLATDCRSAAWLRFARAPVFERGRLFDLRFESDGRGNFTSMRHEPASAPLSCPPRVPAWAMPRADALTPTR